jgi:hypothetical protein
MGIKSARAFLTSSHAGVCVGMKQRNISSEDQSWCAVRPMLCPLSVQSHSLLSADGSAISSPLGESSIPGKFRAACELGWKLHHQSIALFRAEKAWPTTA